MAELSMIRGAWLTRRELSRLLGVSERTIERWGREGLPVERWSSRIVRYRLDRVEGWLRRKDAA